MTCSERDQRGGKYPSSQHGNKNNVWGEKALAQYLSRPGIWRLREVGLHGGVPRGDDLLLRRREVQRRDVNRNVTRCRRRTGVARRLGPSSALSGQH